MNRLGETSFTRLAVWVFYLLGVTDGMSRSVETFKSLNPEPLNDPQWRTTLRSCLPSELAALRQPNASTEPAARIIEQELMRIRQRRAKRLRRKGERKGDIAA